MADLSRRYPSVAHMKEEARTRIPGFAWEYMTGGIGPEENVRRNVDDLQAVQMMPRYLNGEADVPLFSTSLFGAQLDAPFGVAPMGLNGLIWPGCEKPIAAAARAQNIVHVLSTHATQSLEDMKRHSGASGWFQLYPPNDPEMESDLIRKAREAGYQVLVVTVDIPAPTRRDRDIRNGLSVPPEITMRTLSHVLTRPRWLLRLAQYGMPHFRNLEPYAPPGLSITQLGAFLGKILSGHITADRLKRIRDQWPGKLVVKGVLDPDEAAIYMAAGADGVIVSNHGGRQLDAAPSSAAMLPKIRAKLGPEALVMVDGGVRSGLDIARMIALGADYVFLGRPFLFAAAVSDEGPAHLIDVLKQELFGTMQQVGAATLSDLPSFLHKP
ncbi:alpha-hydroxy acid oxidase [Rhizobium sp. FKL33]|uniref:alpha-hydroxy acid oxidase n=1 Tax=Rhizobium sp. FKL33 TaxID=2562307 RepID=UPI0010BFEE24|nr:alpha-hydroxy acid oxidase [Rhizobium sp. FKL33]